MIEIYRKHLEARLLAPTSVRHHLRALGLFVRWLAHRQSGTERDIRDVSLQDLLDYHGALASRRTKEGRTTSVAYRNRQMWVVKNFLTFLWERRRILVDPGENFPPLRKPRHLPKGVLSNAQVLRLLGQPDVSTPGGCRDRAVLELLYSSGLRGQELCRLTIYDLDFKEGTLRVIQGKGRRDRIVPIGRTAGGYLRSYMEEIRPGLLAGPRGKSAVDSLFVNDAGGRLTPAVLRRMIRRHAKSAGLPGCTGAHGLRHACATEMLKGGASVRHVQELLGHLSLATTQIYTRVVPADLQKVHAATAPSERRRKVAAPEFECRGFREKRGKAGRSKRSPGR